MTNTKQLKITKLFRKGVSRVPEDVDDLQEEIEQLEQRLKERQDELFQMQRANLRRKISPIKKRAEPFVRPQKIVLTNAIEGLKNNLELTSMLTGVEVQSYEVGEHCCVLFHMQHDSPHELKHGLRIEMQRGANIVSKSSLPLGFNLSGVMEDYDNIMLPECLGSIRKALVAYYDRLQQFEALKKMLNIDAQLFKILDGSHIEITFAVQSNMEQEEDQINLVLLLDYKVYDIRPKQFAFKDIDLPESAILALKEQCTVFKRKPLRKAFKEAFLSDVGPYKLVQQVGADPEQRQQPRRLKRFRGNNYNYNNDDTFRPDDCSGDSDDGDN
ncbi:uncharacterized protein LOC115447834 [Manduca sexta]|uniref:Centromere protein O n=1 Tax=Manduca sexta TaxID=7130 RepID=A0A922CSM6_MANSE|nr:uncharacterized protein LOC115447834 [Manduca sexta]KAG6456922.1 hypothetical protein O3G_MSEX010023 [Manduca sexta]